MPYISTSSRIKLDNEIEKLSYRIESEGELNYAITNLLLKFNGLSRKYKDYAMLLGIVESVKLELYRKLVAPYEEEKEEENGRVY